MKVETVQMSDGTSTQVHHFDSADIPQGTIVFLAALGVSISYYRTLAQLLAERGFNVALIETRGMRFSSVNDVKQDNFGYKEILDTDLDTILPHIRQLHASLPLWIGGHSLGGQLALLYASKQRVATDGVFLIASGSNYYANLPGLLPRLRRRIGFGAVQLISNLLGYFPGHRLGFGGRQPKNLVKDWTHEGKNGHYRVVNCEQNYEHYIATFPRPVVMLCVKEDKLVPTACAQYLANKLKRSTVDVVEIDSTQNGLMPFDHFNWAKNPTIIIDALCAKLSHATSR
ncbi:MAG: alpha/beta fold hydrolase [Pseudohongiellaceae bacterium]|nr:alpha/beta fold hydrolase [Pseudohongiellaceae bacterium]